MRLFQVLEVGCVWDVTAFFRLAVAFAVVAAGAGGGLAGAGAFVSFCLCRVLFPLLFEGFLYAFGCIAVGAVSAIGVIFVS